jgi:hypothetical protein
MDIAQAEKKLAQLQKEERELLEKIQKARNDESRVCLVCSQYQRYSSTRYVHVYCVGDISKATCKPPAAFGKHVCWNCGKDEDTCLNDAYYRHDIHGSGHYTCLAPTPSGKQRCSNCHGILEPHEDHYHDFDQGGYWKCQEHKY